MKVYLDDCKAITFDLKKVKSNTNHLMLILISILPVSYDHGCCTNSKVGKNE